MANSSNCTPRRHFFASQWKPSDVTACGRSKPATTAPAPTGYHAPNRSLLALLRRGAGPMSPPPRIHRQSCSLHAATTLTVLYQPSYEEKKHAQTPPGTPNKTAHHTEYSTLMPHLLRDVVLFPAPSSSSHDPPHQLHQVLRRVGVLVKQERSSG